MKTQPEISLSKHYSDYFWKDGKPQGIGTTSSLSNVTYKIIADPYYKRISIEKYIDGSFKSLVYDSALFDFRDLKPDRQTAWQKITISETKNTMVCHLRNQDDRLVVIEEYFFEHSLCRECKAYSPQRILLSIQKMHYKALNDSFNGVLLYDANEHPVLYKHYEIDSSGQEFAQLLEEQWDMLKKI